MHGNCQFPHPCYSFHCLCSQVFTITNVFYFTARFEGLFSLKFGELRTLPVDEQWYSLGKALGMAIQELESIKKIEANAFKCKAQMFRLWLQNDPVASLEKLATALEEINKTELANDVRSHHFNDVDMVSSGYGSVESSISSVSWNKGSEENETDSLKHGLPNLGGNELV